LKDWAGAQLPLDGQWQFHVGDDYSLVLATLDDTGWSICASTGHGDQGHSVYTGLRVSPACRFRAESGIASEVVLYMRTFGVRMRCIGNGSWLVTSESLPTKPFFRFGAPQDIWTRSALQGVLAIRVWTAAFDQLLRHDRELRRHRSWEPPKHLRRSNPHTDIFQAKRTCRPVQMLILIEVVLIGFVAWGA